MPRPLDHAKREQLLAGVVDYIDKHGLSNVSLRPLAAALNTSSRMLVHYFGTKEELLVQALETQQPKFGEAFADVHEPKDLVRALHSLWFTMTEGQDVLSSRILLQAMGVAAGRPGPFVEFVDTAIAHLLDSLSAAISRCGIDTEQARIQATTASAAFRGLLLDRMITHDIHRTDAAAALLIDSLATATSVRTGSR